MFIVKNNRDNNDEIIFIKSSLYKYTEIVLSTFQKLYHRLIFVIIINLLNY